VHYVLHGLARIFVVSVRITFVYVRAYHPFVSVSIRHSERSEEFFSVLLCANLCNLWIIFKSQNLSAVADFQIET
jgi:hypothetical protein